MPETIDVGSLSLSASTSSSRLDSSVVARAEPYVFRSYDVMTVSSTLRKWQSMDVSRSGDEKVMASVRVDRTNSIDRVSSSTSGSAYGDDDDDDDDKDIDATPIAGSKLHRCWEAARATSALPQAHRPLVLNGKYYDGGLLCNNPIEIVWREARRAALRPTMQIDRSSHSNAVHCVVSIGSGLRLVAAARGVDSASGASLESEKADQSEQAHRRWSSLHCNDERRHRPLYRRIDPTPTTGTDNNNEFGGGVDLASMQVEPIEFSCRWADHVSFTQMLDLALMIQAAGIFSLLSLAVVLVVAVAAVVSHI